MKDGTKISPQLKREKTLKRKLVLVRGLFANIQQIVNLSYTQKMKDIPSDFSFCPDANFKNCLRSCDRPYDLTLKKLFCKSYLPFQRNKKTPYSQ